LQAVNNPKTLADYLSIFFLLCFVAWLVISPLLQMEMPLFQRFALLGIPLAGFFIVKPHRLKWLFSVVLGLNGLDNRSSDD
jgi:hypothetical protein